MFSWAVERCSHHRPRSMYVDICVSWVSKRSVFHMEQRAGDTAGAELGNVCVLYGRRGMRVCRGRAKRHGCCLKRRVMRVVIRRGEIHALSGAD